MGVVEVKSPAETEEALSESNGSESNDADGSASTGSDVAGSDAVGPASQERAEADADGADDSGDAAADGEDVAADARPQRRSKLRWIAAAVLVAVLAVAGYEGWLLYQHHQRDVAAAQALAAAEDFALTLTTIDPNAVDANIDGVLDGSTGDFKNLYQESSAQLRQVLIDNKATANGMVVDAAVKSATKDRVEVVLFIDQAVSNATATAPQLDRSRVVMTMEKVDGRWLASQVDLP